MKLKNLNFIAILFMFVAVFSTRAQTKTKYTPDAKTLEELQKTISVAALSEDWTNLNEERSVDSPNKARTAYVASFSIGGDSKNVRGLVVILENKTDKFYEIQGLDSPRPIENVRWQSNDIIVFEQWMNARRGGRYAINVRTKKLVGFGFLE